MNITGKLEFVGEVENFSGKFETKSFVVKVEDNPDYPQLIKVELHQDKINLIDKFKIGDEVEVEINLRGRKFTNSKGETTYYNSIVGWRVNALTEGVDNGNSADDEDDSGLPF